jgi:hypothetical protein
MSTTSDGKEKKNWLKLAIVPLLLGVLGYVVWSNLSPSQATPAVDLQPTPSATTIAASTPTEKSTAPESRKQKRVAWPKFTTDQILATNPFRGSTEMRAALMPPLEPIAVASSNGKSNEEEEEVIPYDPWLELVDSFKEESIGVYIETSKGPAVKIGTRLLHVGDQIGGHYRIIEIRQNGLVVEAAPASH